ncbi:MAG: CPBP family intramembrane glutamic endopeptidase [Flavisolibacter sp.]|jgi:membrane protease YdiL (CAAX protease family)
MQTYLKTKPVWVQFLLFLGMSFGIFMVLIFAGVFVLTKITGIGLAELQDFDKWDPNNPDMIFFLRGMMLIQFLGLFFIPALLFAYISDPSPKEYLQIRKPYKASFWILGVAIMLIAIPFVEYIGFLNQKMSLGGSAQNWMKSKEEEAAKQIRFMLNRHTPGQLFINLIFISLFAGIGEELFFRGILQRMFIRALKNAWAGIIITAIIFSAFHLQFFGFFPRLFLGIILGAIYWYSGSILTAMLAHFIYDALIITLVYLHPEMMQDVNEPMINSPVLPVYAIVSAALTLLLIRTMKKQSRTSYNDIYRNDGPALNQPNY